ncbi:MAG: hypothetical protein K940chlam9_01642 [Chlamydiae bacterium]|nr:hypothetical protein [Chlamydiota bacterium]
MKRFLLLVLLTTPVFATEYGPWFPPLWELQGRFTALYDKTNFVQSPKGNFQAPSNDYSIWLELDVTPWPYWHVEGEVYLTHTSEVAFTYQLSRFSLCYQWLSDIEGDPITWNTGITAAFPGGRFLEDFSYTYHGYTNFEFRTSIGKEWAREGEWYTRGWAYGGFGIANKGAPWVHGLAVWECKPFSCLELAIFSEAIYGFGDQDLEVDEPFEGYGLINHQFIDLGWFFLIPIGNLANFSFYNWYNVHAHNFVENYWGVAATLHIPFSL